MQQFKPGIVIVDFGELLPAPTVCDFAAQILVASSPNTRIIVLSKHTEEFRVRAALELGIRGYVLKTRTADELLRSIEEVSHGRTYFSPEVAHVVADLVLEPFTNRGSVRRASQLTDCVRQVVTLIAEGNSTKEVAARLGISVKTADCHRTRIMDKLNSGCTRPPIWSDTPSARVISKPEPNFPRAAVALRPPRILA